MSGDSLKIGIGRLLATFDDAPPFVVGFIVDDPKTIVRQGNSRLLFEELLNRAESEDLVECRRRLAEAIKWQDDFVSLIGRIFHRINE